MIPRCHTRAPWFREGAAIYALEPAGWSTKVEQYRNRFYLVIQAGPMTPYAEIEANARLITAAPEMYDVLAAVQVQCAANTDVFSQRVWNLTDAVLAKAKGVHEPA